MLGDRSEELMNTKYQTKPWSSRCLAIFGLLTIGAVPAVATALETATNQTAPIAALDAHCEQATVEVEVDVATGNFYYINPVTRNLTLIQDDLNVYFGSLGHVVLVIHYTSGEWEVEVTPDSDPSVTYQTNNGSLRYSLDDDFAEYIFSSTALSSASVMATMTPVVPDFPIKIKRECPPS